MGLGKIKPDTSRPILVRQKEFFPNMSVLTVPEPLRGTI
jgi:hypothetical protein